MIVCDIPRGGKNTPQYQNQAALCSLIRGMGVMCEPTPLDAGDACFEGNGPDGTIAVGVERKALHDMLGCIEDAHYAGKQRLGMKKLYQVNFLVVEGLWRSHEDGRLMESKDGCTWWPCKPNGRGVMYSKLRRYLISMTYSGVIVLFTRDLKHTAQDICELWHYHQKAWNKHTSLREIPKAAIPQLNGSPSLARKWADAIDGIGVKMGEDADRLFSRKAIRLATADESDWLKLDRMSVSKAQGIVRQIHGIGGQ